MSKARELAELSRTVSDSADAVAITIDASENVTFSEDINLGDGKKAIFGLGGVINFSDRGNLTHNASTYDMTFNTNSLANALVIKGTGLVGIGTSSPDTLMELRGADPILTIRDSSTSSAVGNATLRLAETGANDALDQYFDIKATAGQLQIIDNWNEGGGTGTRVVVDDSGNVGLGLVPNTWSVGRALELGFEGNALWGNAADEVIVVQNAYYNSGWKYATTRPATHYSQYNGGHRWFTAPSGTADAALSWTQAMTLSSSGNLLVGGTNTAPGAGNTVAGVAIRGGSDNRSFFSASSNYVAAFNRNTNDGNIVEFNKDGSTVGSIGVLNNNNLRITGDVADHGGLQFGTHSVVPMEAGSDSDGTIDLGASAARFKDLYLSGGVNFNGSSGGINTANRSFLMDEYEIGTCTIGLNTSNGDASLSRQDNAIGYYQKTGDICTVQFYSGGLTFSAAGTGTARVTGLPFNSRGGTYDYGVCSVTHNTATTTDLQNGYTAPNNNFITLTQRHATASGIWRTSGVRYFMFSITYLTQ